MTITQGPLAYDPLAGVRRFELEKLYVHENMPIPNRLFLQPGRYADMLREAGHKLQTYVWGKRDTHVVGRVPATWWDHYKKAHRQRCNPWGWALRKLTVPPAMKEVRVDISAWLPELSLEHDGQRMTIVNFDANLLPIWEDDGDQQ